MILIKSLQFILEDYYTMVHIAYEEVLSSFGDDTEVGTVINSLIDCRFMNLRLEN